MLDLRGGYHGRCCISELEEADEWVNMPIGRQEEQDGAGYKDATDNIEDEKPPGDDDDSDSEDEDADEVNR